MKTIDVVLPVYNEAAGISDFHEALASVLGPLGERYRFNVIYVLDRSLDGTFGVLKKLADHCDYVTVLHLSRRFGHQMSLVAGIDYSQADAVIMMDCDQEHPPAIIPLLLEKFDEGYEIVHTIREYATSVPF